MRRIFRRFNILILTVFLLGACNNMETIEHVSVYVVETQEVNDGVIETTGYQKVNEITVSSGNKDRTSIEVQAIEDFYDTKGNYKHTEISYGKYDTHNLIRAMDNDMIKKVVKEPSTILIPDENIEHFNLNNMTEEEKAKVKKHVQSFVKDL